MRLEAAQMSVRTSSQRYETLIPMIALASRANQLSLSLPEKRVWKSIRVSQESHVVACSSISVVSPFESRGFSMRVGEWHQWLSPDSVGFAFLFRRPQRGDTHGIKLFLPSMSSGGRVQTKRKWQIRGITPLFFPFVICLSHNNGLVFGKELPALAHAADQTNALHFRCFGLFQFVARPYSTWSHKTIWKNFTSFHNSALFALHFSKALIRRHMHTHAYRGRAGSHGRPWPWKTNCNFRILLSKEQSKGKGEAGKSVEEEKKVSGCF